MSVSCRRAASRQATARGRFTRGFTLIEMMIAMTILAVGMGAIIKAAAGSASNSAYLRDREVARWVALNKLTEMQVLQEWSNTTKKGDVEMLGVRWYWQARVRKVQDPDLRRVDVEVRRNPDSDSYVFSVAGFVGNPELVSQ